MTLGDHLFYYRVGAAYSHHGICCGDGTVVHYESSLWLKLRSSVMPHVMLQPHVVPRICRVEWSEFALGSEVFVRPYEQSDSPENVLSRAISRLGEADYDLFDNNCEHFAVWCKTGRAISSQVQAHHAARTALVQSSPLSVSLFRVARRVPSPYRGVAYAGALAIAGSVYAGTYLAHRRRARHARLS